MIAKTKNPKVAKIKAEIEDIRSQIDSLKHKRDTLEIELLQEEIKPFKIGDEVMYPVTIGKNKKLQKGILEAEVDTWATLYIRPYKNDGELSGRHFYISDYTKIEKCGD